MQLPIYQVDAFSDKLFGGNPAAVVPLKEWLSDEVMQKIALENNLSETAFFVPTNDGFDIRWFTPAIEVNLCGHATLATAYVIFNVLKYSKDIINFGSKSGVLKVRKDGKWLELDFPVQETKPAAAPEGLIESLGKTPKEIYRASDDYLLVYNSQKDIEEINPNFSALKNIQARGIIVTAKAKSKKIDFVSRFFGPGAGIDEDPVTGSAHTKLVPYWANRLGKTELNAEQISERKGYLKCKLVNDRVLMAGKGRLYLKGKITI
ncbi:phenazine biosynthesis protein PhzF family [Emticicia oligotrophica DSM 17448]|uniref:Phenazine biosynthesis protein PhzF family n=1 Tax=Emticicia oligotrophica (strain DSM 17448 / CIP 109782 / MTCC 6937 / GPTSA100-15) TaxID=929562 RepID=A0ABM5N6I0_EMTOG|nr:PhzF family phenazine biosynthesis protein [Emticicia oligotrophica]AFK05034.1 phenazine biosynthesis protein PhzF family [Emticicia oligotrophica DSM 17448]